MGLHIQINGLTHTSTCHIYKYCNALIVGTNSAPYFHDIWRSSTKCAGQYWSVSMLTWVTWTCTVTLWKSRLSQRYFSLNYSQTHCNCVMCIPLPPVWFNTMQTRCSKRGPYTPSLLTCATTIYTSSFSAFICHFCTNDSRVQNDASKTPRLKDTPSNRRLLTTNNF